MTYLNRKIVKNILGDIQKFENDLATVFNNHDLNLRDNLGRRNALVSTAQEKATANALRKVYNVVVEDGAPGKPDIYIGDIETELECKITSGSRTKSKKRSFSLQTDWETICKKESLDYVFILTNDSFDEFCVLFFKGLTPEDYYPPASGSRGKSRMNKKNAMKKCNVLYGDFTTLNQTYIERYKERIAGFEEKCAYDTSVMISKCFDRTIQEAGSRVKKIEDFYDKKIKELKNKIKKWEEADPRYSYKLESFKGRSELTS
tara:strand:+ start:2028 stop:2810 length:783 start_codon:yes stop_codon:yes gene_type:complete